MAKHETQESASRSVEPEFYEAASEVLMTPVHCGRFLVTQAPDGRGILLAFGGGGFYQTRDSEGVEEFFSVARVEAGIMMDHDVAEALSQALLQHVSQASVAKNG